MLQVYLEQYARVFGCKFSIFISCDHMTFFRANFRPEVASDVISGAAVEEVDLDVSVNFGDSSFTRILT